MKSGPLCAFLWRILTWCSRRQVTLKARHIPCRLNVIVDKLSILGQTVQTGWSLHPEIFQAICSRWHQPQVDLFATRFNNKLTQFVLPVPDPQPGTIDGYRSTIANKLGNSPIYVSKDENLTRLLDSFHRDRPKGWRGIPSLNLSLVLHQLRKAPFEPLKEASLKHFKTVFLLAQGSGKCRSEIHAWLHKNIRHRSDWSKVSLYPSPSFLSKNQLAKEGPATVAPVVIPALAPTLDKSLKRDRSLCPVRALHYYLDRTSDLRQNKELVFVSFKKDFDKDISPTNIA